MKFGEKIKKARKQAGLSQKAFANAIGVSLRTVTNYETAGMYPKQRGVYYKIAEVLNVDVNYLMTEDEEIASEFPAKNSLKEEKQAQELVFQISNLFSCSKLNEEEKDAIMKAVQDAYWIAKEKNKEFLKFDK